MADQNTKKASEKASDTVGAKGLDAQRRAAFQSDDPVACFNHFLPLAQALDAETVEVSNTRPLVMLHNVQHALSIAEPHLATALAKWPGAPITNVIELPSLIRALSHAVARVPAKALSTGEIEALFTEGSPWRELALKYLEVVSHPKIGLVPEARVRAIREGSGRTNTAQDFSAIPAVFAEFDAALAGKHPFAPETLSRLGEIGTLLLGQLTPKGALRPAAGRSPEGLVRDQFAALARSRYDELSTLVAVAVGFGKAQDLLPSLQSAYYRAPAEEPQAEGEKPTE